MVSVIWAWMTPVQKVEERSCPLGQAGRDGTDPFYEGQDALRGRCSQYPR